MGFSKDFVWGAATASFQIEGAAFEDGKGKSIWDTFSRQPGKVFDAHNGDVACDHYHRYEDDVALMDDLAMQAYRFSIAWPRVMPNGTGAVNEKGLDFYDRLIDSLLKHNITPYVTLYHWDMPHDLYLRGGWCNRESSDWFADYTKVVVDRFSDRVQNWIPLNEPQCFIGLSLVDGIHAPGLNLTISEALTAMHNSLMAHGKAVQTIRSHAKTAPRVGGAPTTGITSPANDKPEVIEAARERFFSVEDDSLWNISWTGDAMVFGKYPEQGVEAYGKDMPHFKDSDFETIAQPMDFFGINIYNGKQVDINPDTGKVEEVKRPEGYPMTAIKWPVTPEALYWGPRFLHERYQLPILITENGLSNSDVVSVDGKVHDPQRIDFLTRYLREYKRAADDGVDLHGYFQWSLMDNFEWAEGYRERFGLVFVDYETQERIPKDSAYWYKQVIESNGENL